jgi:hypothetical protein
MKKSLLVLISICCVSLLNGCGTGSSTQIQDVATHFSVVAATATPFAGVPFNVTVTALDASGQTVATYSGTVQFSSSSGKPVQPSSGMLINGRGTFSVTLSTSGSQTISVSDAGSLSGTSPMLAVSVDAATQLSVSAPANATAGTAFTFTVTARDASNNVVTTYSGTVHITSSDPQAALPANATLTNGMGTFQVTMKTANGETVTATDTATPSITGSSTGINVGPGAATKLSVTAPTTASAGIQFGLTLIAYDPYGNVATGYTGMVHFTITDAQVVPPANAALPSGSATFPITLKTIQSTTITATDTTTSSITGSTTPISVVSNAPTHFGLDYNSGNSIATRTTFNIGVTALDAANNQSVGYTGTLKFISSDSQAHLPANSTLASGAGNFNTVFETPGAQTITVTDTAMASLTITSTSITVTAASTPSITSAAPPAGTFGVNYGPSKTTYYLCFSPYNCTTPCDSANSNCAGYRSCRYSAYPCVSGRTVFGGFTFTAKGGVPSYIWSATGLPQGLNVVPFSARGGVGGEMVGTPTSAGTFNISVTATDSGTPPLASPVGNYTLTIKDPPPPVINATPMPPNGAVNLPYSFTFTASSPASPFTWRVSVGSLPAGLTLNPDGVLSGAPTATGSTSITLIATDEFKQDSAPQVFNIQIFAHGFEATGSMVTVREAATATLLNTGPNSGKVLVAGGTSTGGGALNSAELYDPTNKTFSATGSMATGRHNFTATMLPSGKVLVTGGLDASGNPLISAEIYDPIAGTFSATSHPMTIARASHTATLLNSGKVLVAGWGNATAELFDPSNETFTQTGSMQMARVSHTATLLKSGKVLVTGGIQGIPPNTTVLAEAELYDPGSGSFSATSNYMANRRQWHTATLLNDKDGTVLVTGGLADDAANAVNTADLFNPITGTFTATKGPMETPRAFQTAILLNDGTVLVTGGFDGVASLATAEVFDPTAETFSTTGGMASARQSHTATLLNDGKVLVNGGTDDGTFLATAELYE